MSKNYYEPEDGEMETYISDLGIEKHRIYDEILGWSESYADPMWEYIYTSDGNTVCCPNCGEDDLRYHNGRGCCLECDSTFSDDEISDYIDEEWHHSCSAFSFNSIIKRF